MPASRPFALKTLLERYHVDAQRGFLPRRAPGRLPAAFAAWEALGRDFSARVNAGCLAAAIHDLPLLPAEALPAGPALERAMLLLSVFAHGYLQTPEGQASQRLPAALAVPWVGVAGRLGRPPVLSHASLVLQNWRRLDSRGPLAPDNLTPLIMFQGGPDEAWFYTLTVAIEAAGAAALVEAIRLRLALNAGHLPAATTALDGMLPHLEALPSLLQRMPERCDPGIFYHRLRPFLASLQGVHYEGVSDPVRSYAGGSAAQSSLLQSLDAVLGVAHPDPAAGAFLRDMRAYMPPAHAQLITWLESGPPLTDWDSLGSRRAACLAPLLAFRQAHLRIAAQYIIAPAREAGLDTTGTGGTEPITFLKTVRNETGRALR